MRDFDFYRKIPKDLTETSTHGTILSLAAAVFMLILFVAELSAFLSPQYLTNVLIDSSSESQLRINFNITVLDMPCEFATIDVIEVGECDSLCVYSTSAEPDTLALLIAGGTVGALEQIKQIAESRGES